MTADHPSAQTNERSEKLTTLITMLCCNDLDTHAVQAIVRLCEQVQKEPVNTLTQNYGSDAAQVARYDPKGMTAFVIFVELEDYFAVSDTVDEMHEQIVAAFETPLLPDYPYQNGFETLSDYFQWLDAELLAHHPRYQLIQFGQSYTHDFQVVLVYREDVARILELSEQLEVDAAVCQ